MTLPKRSEEWDDELDPREASWWNPTSWSIEKDINNIGKDVIKGVGDLATGNLKGVGKDWDQGVKSVEGVGKDLVHMGEGAVNLVKDHWKQILPAALLAVQFVPGLDVAVDVGLAADAIDTAATAADVTTTAESAASAVPSIGEGAVSATEKGLTDVAQKQIGNLADDAIEQTSRDVVESAPGRASQALSKAKDMIGNAADKAKDLAGSATDKAKDFIKNPVNDIAVSQIADSGNSQPQQQQSAPAPVLAPPPVPQYVQAPTDTSTTAEGAAISAPSSVVTGSKQDKVLELVEQFGLHPEDIKRSLTSWV
jgi:hypothetical protein